MVPNWTEASRRLVVAGRLSVASQVSPFNENGIKRPFCGKAGLAFLTCLTFSCTRSSTDTHGSRVTETSSHNTECSDNRKDVVGEPLGESRRAA